MTTFVHVDTDSFMQSYAQMLAPITSKSRNAGAKFVNMQSVCLILYHAKDQSPIAFSIFLSIPTLHRAP